MIIIGMLLAFIGSVILFILIGSYGLMVGMAGMFGLLLSTYVRTKKMQEDLQKVKEQLRMMESLVSQQEIGAELELALNEGNQTKTIIYFVRHAESPYMEGMERTRGLSEQGRIDAARVKMMLRGETIDHFVSSPYERAIQTIRPLAEEQDKDIVIMEGLRERVIGTLHEMSFKEAKQSVYQDFQLKFPGGESSAEAQARGVKELMHIIEELNGKSIVVGTHGDIMTLMMNYFDPQYAFDFWESTSMPDVYRLEFAGKKLSQVTRVWDGGAGSLGD